MKTAIGLFAFIGIIFFSVAVWKTAMTPPYTEYDLMVFGLSCLLISSVIDVVRKQREKNE